ncbi:46294_t:CDS:2 [Gigaspora margarita]|uniref:46294_t:CDS:1 n=1 Tax=Gigaspora margarita TaxID=4874 RepID=A0ABN7V273_GIGMA|nr:46294_t:CDS:2 [Gigaspora margarita]
MKPENPSPPRINVEIPEAKANLFSIFTFWWANDLISLGYKRHLEKDDLYVLNDERTAKILTDNFEIEWQKETQKMAIGKKPSLLKALYRVLWLKFCLAGVCRLVGDILIVTSPFILRFILKFVSDAYYANFNNGVQPPAHVGYTLIVIMFLMQMSATISQNLYFYWGMETGILSRTILITAIYRKALVLSGKARGLFTNGKITNLMSTDTTRIDFACGYFHMIWTVPIQICLSLIFLIYNIGPSTIAGFALLLLMGLIQGKVISLLARTRAKAVVITDERVKLIQEILLGIRAIKYYAWEDSFADALNKLRNKEISFVRFLIIFRASVVGVLTVLPVFASVLSFTIFSLTGGNLDAEIAFSSVALFYTLQSPLVFLQFTMSSVADAYVSINRINDFLLADELTVLPGINPDEKYAIKVTDSDFIWETASSNETINKSNEKKKKEKSIYYRNDDNSETDFSKDFNYEKAPSSFDAISDISTALTPIEKTKYLENSPLLIPKSQLRKINISIPRGKLVAIVGHVGSGKSSLLSALIGEMKRIKGEAIFGENVGYCPQTAWIQNATLRDNITFGLPFNYEKYQQVIKDCCLEPDLLVLPSGDLTEIGEKGINLSGGQKQRVNVARAVYYNADIILLDDPLSAVDAHVGRCLFTNCIKGALAKKTRLLVTHHLYYLPQVDYIICMEDGEIAEQGTYEELMKNRKNFSKLIAEYGEVESDDKIKEDEESTLDIKENIKDQTVVLSKGLISIEEQYKGAVNYKIYLAYIRNAGLDSVLRSSLYAHFSETLTGLPTIRAYRVQKNFLRLDVVPSIIGLVLAYALQITQAFNLLVNQLSKLETDMNSVERLVYYCDNLEVEAENIVLENRPPSGWPAHGEIHIKNLKVKYGPDSPLILKGISVDIMAAEKIGIVGRTGCGKSTLAISFFRLIEATSGSIVIDNVDISTIGLKDLRSNITIIPQDPVLFNGTIRSNLDPFNKHSDLELWNALCHVHLIKNSYFTPKKEESEELEVIHSISDQKNDKQEPIMLDSPVKENGSNFSQGQQQLIAIARALVRHSKLIIMDEATASIDFKTDNLIQTTIREKFKNSTVITIAHRLRTVADYDRILVMGMYLLENILINLNNNFFFPKLDDGNIVEFDIPYLLIQKPDGLFREMCERSGEFAKLIEIAKQKYESI